MTNRIAKIISLVLIFLFITGCGYMPASKQARKVVGDKIYVEVIVSLEDPENSVLIKDATREAVITSFHSSLVPQAEAKTTLWVELSSISFSALQFDSNGYVVVYRANIQIIVTRRSNGETKAYHSKGNYDFSIEPNAIITNSQRYDAIKNSSLKALDSFIAQVGAEGSRI